ncbi:MAG: c-type cytochrome [Pseudomonadota bacterium]
MDKYTAGILALGGPSLFFVVLLGASGSLYQTTSIPVNAASPAVEVEEPAEDAQVIEEAPEEDVAEADTPADVDPAAEKAPAEDIAAAEGPEEAPVTAEADASPETAPEQDVAEADTAPEATPEEDVAEADTTPESSPEEDVAEADAAPEAAPATVSEEVAEADAAPEGDAVPESVAAVEAPDAEAHEAVVVEASAEAAPAADLSAVAAAGDLRAGGRLWRQCSACHVADQAQNRVGPHLVDIIGRDKASIDGFSYSDALSDMGGVWTIENMDAWLENPAEYAAGNRMSYRGLRDAEDRANLLAFLADLQLQQQ